MSACRGVARCPARSTRFRTDTLELHVPVAPCCFVFQVPRALEELVKGPWDPQGELWRRQLDMAAQVRLASLSLRSPAMLVVWAMSGTRNQD